METLGSSKMFREYERAYSKVTNLPIALRPVESWKLPFHGKQKENSWCVMMTEKSGTCGICLQMQEQLAKASLDKPCSLTCAYGLCEMAVPIKLGPDTIGFLQTGQSMYQKPNEASFHRAVKKAQEMGIDLDAKKAREAFFNTPVVSEEKMESLSGLLSIFADHLSMKSNQIAVQAANTEPKVITRARKFIAEHQNEGLSLGQVARSVNMSKFYFCKMFKKATGINFSNYVMRVRTERARDLLLNPNLHVSEIAYEAGFQSLTHFNRMFKRTLGQSPTVYRSCLPMAT
ncbi:MAG: helix-turn-helix domain-containing protein [Verrucomicrobiota bacterium]